MDLLIEFRFLDTVFFETAILKCSALAVVFEYCWLSLFRAASLGFSFFCFEPALEVIMDEWL